MRCWDFWLGWLALVGLHGSSTTGFGDFHRRQDSLNPPPPTLSADGAASATDNLSVSATVTSATESADAASTTSTGQPTSLSASEGPGGSNNSTATSSTLASTPRTHPPPSATGTNSTSAASHKHTDALPIEPRITPALSIGGVILLLTGIAYNLIGVKNRWVQIFLSTAYLTSLSVAVLIDYVMHPPISNAIQGAYFVAIFMTGVLFGAGALIFKEVTEGLGCLLGGFCLGMWFLTLKPGGLVTSSTGKGIFVGVFCIVVWSLSFSHYTRSYGLIGSTSFAGATAFVLGIDCFSKAGLKEFWFYIWGLNADLFPLNTTTFPITRGLRVEIIAIVLGCLIGVMSQIKLWIVVKDKRRQRDATRLEDQRRKNVVDEAVGRHLERHNDRDRANWEKHYGNSLNAKRSTILWSDAHPDKRYTHISTTELLTTRSRSSESLEMSGYGAKRMASTYGSKIPRQSTVTIDVIPEEREVAGVRTSLERQKALTALEDNVDEKPDVDGPKNPVPEVIPLPFTEPSDHESSSSPSSACNARDPRLLDEVKGASKRRSLQSILSLTPRLSTENPGVSDSQEELVLREPHSRPSSIAATLDEENDGISIEMAGPTTCNLSAPDIVVSPSESKEECSRAGLEEKLNDLTGPLPTPPELESDVDFDPEELSRPVGKPSTGELGRSLASSTNGERKQNGVEAKDLSTSGETASPSYTQSQHSTNQTSASEGLTKGALEYIPSHLSNVVLSYRTNEWAKHISTAEEPVYDEPEAIGGIDEEPATQVAPPSPDRPAANKKTADPSTTMAASSAPSPLHVTASNANGQVVTNVRPPSRPVSDFSSDTASCVGLGPIPSDQSSRPGSTKAKRPSLTKPSLAVLPIDENAVSDFSLSAYRHSVGRRDPLQRSTSSGAGVTSSLARPWTSQGPHGVDRSTFARPSTSQGSYHHLQSPYANAQYLGSHGSLPSHVSRSNSYSTMQRSESGNRLSGSSNFLGDAAAMCSDTRLDMHDSRQPAKRDLTSEAQRRENLLAEWRRSQQQGATFSQVPKADVDVKRAQMLVDKEHKKLLDGQERTTRQQKQQAMDQVMRRPDMQDLHREALRKMQANAAKKL